MEHAQNTLNQLLASREDFRQKVEVMGGSRLVPPPSLCPQGCRAWVPCLPTLWEGGWEGTNGTVSVDVFLCDFSPFGVEGWGGGEQVEVTIPGLSPPGAADADPLGHIQLSKGLGLTPDPGL